MTINKMLKFIKSLFKKKINPKPTGNNISGVSSQGKKMVKIWNPNLVDGGYLIGEELKEFIDRGEYERSLKRFVPKHTGEYSGSVNSNLEEPFYSSPCTNHDSYSYDQDNSSNDSSSSSDSSSDFGGGDFGGGGAGGDY